MALFKFSGAPEALMLLAHYTGDIYQPLHVATIYLDAQGRTIDTDHGRHGLANDTNGDNRLY